MKFPKYWTTVTLFSKTIALILFIFLPFIGYWVGVNYQQSLDLNQNSNNAVVNKRVVNANSSIDTSNWQTYTNNQYSFMFNYPPDFTIVVNSSDYIPPYNLSNLIVLLNKKGFQDKTSQYSEDADFSVSSSTDTANCYSYNDNMSLSNTPLTDKQTINGTVYYIGKLSSTAASHSSNGTFYRVKKNNSCFEISLVIETQTGGGQGLGGLKDQIISDQQKLQSELNQILYTYSFINQNQTITPTCIPKPACLNSTPRCLIAKPVNSWCK